MAASNLKSSNMVASAVQETAPLLPPAENDDAPSNITISAGITPIILALWSGSFISAMDSTIVSTTMSSIASSLNDSRDVSIIATSYLLTNAAFQPIYGKASDVFGRRTVLLFAQFWFALGCLLCSRAVTLKQFAASRAISGIGGGGLSALSSIIVSDIIPLRSRGMFQGYANLMYGAGQMLGGPIGGLFLQTVGWRWMFACQVPFVAIASFLVFSYVHEYTPDHQPPPNEHKFSKKNVQRVDILGSITLAVAIGFFLLIFSASSKQTAWKLAVMSLVFVLLFAYLEKYFVKENLIPMAVFKGPLRITCFVAFFGAMTTYANNFLLPLYLQIVHDLSPVQSGLFNASGVISISLGSLAAGVLLKRAKKGSTPEEEIQFVNMRATNVSIYAVLICFLGTLVNLLVISLTQPTLYIEDLSIGNISSWIWLVFLTIGFFGIGFGYGGFLVSLLVLVVGMVGPKNQASASGMNYLFRSLGSVTGVGLSLSIYDIRLGQELKHFFHKKVKDKELGKKMLKNLLSDTGYLRNGLPEQYLHKVLKRYQDCLSDAATLVVLFSSLMLTLVLCLKLVNFTKNKRSYAGRV